MTTSTEIGGISVRVEADTSSLTQSVSTAGDAVSSLSDTSQQTANIMDQAFGSVLSNIESALMQAAETGKFSFKDMVTSILKDLQRMAVQKFIMEPISDLLGGLFKTGGGRALGGPVMSGQAYMVGERGPEVFVPGSNGRVLPSGQSGSHVTVNFNLPPGSDANSFRQSQGQIAAMVSRAVSRGQRNL